MRVEKFTANEVEFDNFPCLTNKFLFYLREFLFFSKRKRS